MKNTASNSLNSTDNGCCTLLGAVSFYDEMPETNKPLTIINNKTKEVHEAIRTDYGLWVNGNRVSGCYYSWVYSNRT